MQPKIGIATTPALYTRLTIVATMQPWPKWPTPLGDSFIDFVLHSRHRPAVKSEVVFAAIRAQAASQQEHAAAERFMDAADSMRQTALSLDVSPDDPGLAAVLKYQTTVLRLHGPDAPVPEFLSADPGAPKSTSISLVVNTETLDQLAAALTSVTQGMAAGRSAPSAMRIVEDAMAFTTGSVPRVFSAAAVQQAVRDWMQQAP
jgi:hypothetical protein